MQSLMVYRSYDVLGQNAFADQKICDEHERRICS